MSTDPQHNRVSIVIPAPNPTGSLHLGHALNLTLQDVLARWYRMKGARVFWEGATDHGGSSSEIVMHRMLQSQSTVPRDVPEDAKRGLLESLMNDSVQTITKQFQDLQLTLDCARMRSMADPGVQEEFENLVRTLYRKGYLYWAEKVDDWCYERGQSIPSYDFVPANTLRAIYTLKYAIGHVTFDVDHSELAYLVDQVGVLVPADSDLAKAEGMQAINPLGKRVTLYAANVRAPRPLVPAFDAESHEFCVQRHLEIPCSIDGRGYCRAGVFQGQDFRAAGDDMLQAIRDRGALRAFREESVHVRRCRGTGYRLYERAVPGLFVRSSVLLQTAMDVISSNQISIHPQRHKEWLLMWMKDLANRGEAADWRVTREHLCGNRVPTDVIAAACKQQGGDTVPDYRMDMMISCALWAFTANGKYGESETEIAPSASDRSICVTGLDLLYFWIATIVALSPGVGRGIPFSDVIVHPLITDKRGKKMSKSEGNTIEVDEIIERFRTPALRLYLLSCLDENDDRLSVDPDALGQLAESVAGALRSGHAGSVSGDRISADQIAEDLSRIEKSMSKHEVGSAARVVLSWVTSLPRWEQLPHDLCRRVHEVSEVFLTEHLPVVARSPALEAAVN